MRKGFLVIFSFLIVILAVNNTFGEEKKKMQNERIAVIETNKGIIKFKLFEENAPITTKNFIDLANKGFYNGLKFHRVEPGFVIQGGDPKGNGTGGSEKTIPLEVTPKLKHDSAGVVAMARANDPNSASSQFYITLAPTSFLDMQYAVFGKVVEGLDVVKNIRVGDAMKKVTIADK
ncbi:MAG: peptidylprolyl isomerase [Nitrospirae bacterium]|nr:peptidylprolyl isomerase [Nitrospirota bacterium]